MSDGSGDRFAAGLRSYVDAVASELGVESAAAWCEVAEPSTAYVAVRERSLSHPGRDVMLQWDERMGWVVAIEHQPGEPPVILARIEGDLVPDPVRVARVVRAVLATPGAVRPVWRFSGDSTDLCARISAYANADIVDVAVAMPRIPR